MAYTRHWSAESADSFAHAISFDFVAQIEKELERKQIKQSELAARLGVSESAVSKVLNNPQNLSLRTIASYALALGIKASIVAYEDDDPHNEKGLVPSSVFNQCWHLAGHPHDFWQAQAVATQKASNTVNVFYIYPYFGAPQPWHVHLDVHGNNSEYLNGAVLPILGEQRA